MLFLQRLMAACPSFVFKSRGVPPPSLIQVGAVTRPVFFFVFFILKVFSLAQYGLFSLLFLGLFFGF